MTAFIVGFFHRLYLFDANGAVIRWFGTNTTPNLKERKKISSRVSTGVRSKSRRTYKGFVRKEQSLKTQNQELHKTNSELDRFVYNLARLACPKSMLGLIAIVKSPEI
jgi:hypothetical protein